MQKVFSLKPSNDGDVMVLQSFLNEGYKVIFATPNQVGIAGRGDSACTDSIEGHIVYILEK